jgi:alpha-galactosidase
VRARRAPSRPPLTAVEPHVKPAAQNYEQAAHANGKASNMTATEYRTEFSMWAISASPLVVTTPIMNCTNTGGKVACKGWISELQKEILLHEEVLAINQDETPQGRPLDEDNPAVWARHLSDGSVAVALYNAADAAVALSVDFGALGWATGTRAAVRDLWSRSDLGVFDGRYPKAGGVDVEPHATTLLRITRSA